MAGKPKVLDFFCGAGGWSEGLRQQGFKIVKGVDFWRPAVETHNLNHDLKDVPVDILDYENCPTSVIDWDFEDVEVIVGSPPCVSFSMSNKAGKADKSLGIRLIETYLRVVAYKKWKKGSALQAWYMENVPNSKNYVRSAYSFRQLGLADFAKRRKLDPGAVALTLQGNGAILCAADYGSPQSRERYVCGEWVKEGTFVAPVKTHEGRHVTLGEILMKMPAPASPAGKRQFADPNYPTLRLPMDAITDQFYDTGAYEIEWEGARAAKINHPFMGRMSFPEDLARPSRTIMATRSASTREALIYPTAFGSGTRKGDGEFRLPTVREAASLMGFPYTYQFTGSEGTKWKQIGNAVCPHLSIAIGKSLREKMGLRPVRAEQVRFAQVDNPNDLNTFKATRFDRPPRKKADTKFRRQPFKSDGFAAALVNFDPTGTDMRWSPGSRWAAVLYVGSGKGFRPVVLGEREASLLRDLLGQDGGGRRFVAAFEKAFAKRIGDATTLQAMLMEHSDRGNLLKPTALVDAIGQFVRGHCVSGAAVECGLELREVIGRKTMPREHLYALYAVTRAVHGKGDEEPVLRRIPAGELVAVPA